MNYFSNLKIKYKIALLPVLAVLGLLIITVMDMFLFRQLKNMTSIIKDSNKLSLNLTRHMRQELKYIQFPDNHLLIEIESIRNMVLEQLYASIGNKKFTQYSGVLNDILLDYNRHNYLFLQVSEVVQAISSFQVILDDLYHKNINIALEKINQIEMKTVRLQTENNTQNNIDEIYGDSLRELLSVLSDSMLNTSELLFFSDSERYEEAEVKHNKILQKSIVFSRKLAYGTNETGDKQIWMNIEENLKKITNLRGNIFSSWNRRQELTTALEINHAEIQSSIEKLTAQVDDQIKNLLFRQRWISNSTIFLTLNFLIIISILLIKQITKPLQAFTALINKYRNKDFYDPVKIDANDEIGILASSFNDMIRHRRQAELDLRDSEEQFRFLAENSKDAIYRMSLPGGRYQYMSPASLEIFGYAPDEFYSSPMLIRGIIHPDWNEYFREKWENLLKGNMPAYYEYQIIHKSGDIRWLHQSNVLIRDESGNPKAIEGIVSDITKRKASEKTLIDSEAKFRDLFDFSPQPISLTDVDTGRLIDVNQKLCELSQYTREELIGRKTTELFYTEEERNVLIRELKKHGEVQGLETVLNAKDGSILNTLMFCRFIQIAEMTYILTIWINITEIKKLETQLLQSQKMESIGTLAGGVAHDFNNILGIILGNTELAIDDISKDDPVFENLKKIHQACLRAKDVVGQILTFSRQSEQEKENISIGQLLDESMQLLRSSIPTTIDIRIDNSSRNDIIYASSSQVNRILFNLCSNAAYAMKEKGGVMEIGIKNIKVNDNNINKYHNIAPGDYVQLSVQDTGPGIKPELIGRIFEPYFTTKGVGEGSGMGLAVVHGIVKNHKGDIAVINNSGKGARFEIIFPMVKEKKKVPVEKKRDILGGNEHILFVDDEINIVSLYQQILTRLGYRVTAGSNSSDALDTFRKSPDGFDLVITDMTMPEMTGVDLAGKLMEIRSNIPIILCTGYSDLINKDAAEEIGIKAFAMKPLTINDFAKLIRNVLDKWKMAENQ